METQDTAGTPLPPYQRLRALCRERAVCGIGLMSGTSVDAVDAALVEIGGREDFPLRLLAFEEIPFDDSMRARLLTAMDLEASRVDELCQLNAELGERFAKAALAVLRRAGARTDDVRFIGSHGQTFYHVPVVDPARGWRIPSTLQLGDPCRIAERTGITTVAGFRERDMAAGGIGAPLIPFVDAFLFADSSRDVLCQNLGGIANCTLLRRGGEMMAFDTGPGNMLMDALVRKHHPGQRCDRDGALARQGRVLADLLRDALEHPFFHQTPPKATGHETFGRAYLDWFDSRGGSASLPDRLATACELTVLSIHQAYQRFIFPCATPEEVIVSGGGTQNPWLMQRLAEHCPELRWKRIDNFGLASSAKEAAGFAVLAYATLCGIPANIPSVTGAKRSVILGQIIPGKEL